MMQDDEISLYDLWEKLRDGWKTVAVGLVLGIAGAVAGIVLISPKYEAVAVIQVGQVGQVGQGKVSGQPVEPPAQAVERMKAPAFQWRVAEALNDQAWLQAIASSATGVSKALSLQVIKGTVGAPGSDQIPLIELRTEGDSPEVAKRKAQAVVAELVKLHGELAHPALTRMHADLAVNRDKLAGAERDLVALTKLVEAAGIKDDRFTQLALMTSLRIQKEAETFGQRQMIMALETALEVPATQSARAIEGIFVSEKPVSPKKALLLALGVIGGLLAGVVFVFFSDAWGRAKRERAAT
jgi:uncharacterized protein involved in exopolysaccharide biosynthesis